MAYIPIPIVINPDGTVDVRELPHVSEMGAEEGWTYNFKDMVDDWSTGRKESSDAWSKELIRGAQRLDDFQGKLNQEYLDARTDARSLRTKLDNVFATAFGQLVHGAVERQGTAQGAMANQMTYDSQRVAEAAIEQAMAGEGTLEATIRSTIGADVAETLRESIVAMGTALAAQIAAMGDSLAAEISKAMMD